MNREDEIRFLIYLSDYQTLLIAWGYPVLVCFSSILNTYKILVIRATFNRSSLLLWPYTNNSNDGMINSRWLFQFMNDQ